MTYNARLTGVPAIVGGVLWALVPFLDDIYPVYENTLAIIPLLLLVSVYGLYHRSSGSRPSLGREEILPLATGFALLFVAALVYAYGLITNAGIVLLFFIGAPAILGVILVAVGSAFTAYTLWKQQTLPPWLTLLFALSLPLDPLFNGFITPHLSAGLSLYGIAWVVLGTYLLLSPAPTSEENNPSSSMFTSR